MTSGSHTSLPGPLHSPGASLPFKIMGGLAGLLVLLVVGGLLLPGTWSAHRTAVIRAPAEEIFPYLDTPARWDRWTPWGEVESELEGPARGPGARRSWNHPEQGEGFLEIVATDPPREVRYRVQVDGGAIRMEGRLRLEEVRDGTRVAWEEEGDFGWNPILGYMALTMERSQGAQMSRSLERLRDAVRGGGPGS